MRRQLYRVAGIVLDHEPVLEREIASWSGWHSICSEESVTLELRFLVENFLKPCVCVSVFVVDFCFVEGLAAHTAAVSAFRRRVQQTRSVNENKENFDPVVAHVEERQHSNVVIKTPFGERPVVGIVNDDEEVEDEQAVEVDLEEEEEEEAEVLMQSEQPTTTTTAAATVPSWLANSEYAPGSGYVSANYLSFLNVASTSSTLRDTVPTTTSVTTDNIDSKYNSNKTHGRKKAGKPKQQQRTDKTTNPAFHNGAISRRQRKQRNKNKNKAKKKNKVVAQTLSQVPVVVDDIRNESEPIQQQSSSDENTDADVDWQPECADFDVDHIDIDEPEQEEESMEIVDNNTRQFAAAATAVFFAMIVTAWLLW